MGNVLFSVLWLIVLLFIGWPVAGFCAGFYILFAPFEPCISACSQIQELLMKGIQWPKALGKAIMDGSDKMC